MAQNAPPRRRVAVVGGGWAGCAAAVTLAGAGIAVTLFEQARTLGGRARRVAHDDLPLDNGQHLLIGAYRQTLDLLGIVHGAERVAALFHRVPLTLQPFGAARRGDIALTACRAPAPLHLAGAILFARGLSAHERISLIADASRLARQTAPEGPEDTVARRHGRPSARVYASVWAPLCLAALNTQPHAASSRLFASVLRSAFTGGRQNSDFLVPAGDLSTLFPDAAARFVSAHGGTFRTGVSVAALTRAPDGASLDVGAAPESFDAAVVAVGPHQLRATVGAKAAGEREWADAVARVDAFAYESITTIYLGLAGAVSLAAPLLRLDDAPGHWLFDRSAILGRTAAPNAAAVVAVVISANGAHDDLDHPTLAHHVEAQLRRLAPSLPPVVWTRVIAERRATYACTPALLRPASGRIAPGLYLAGDYTDPDFPPTLEAATRSGVAAANAVIADLAAARG